MGDGSWGDAYRNLHDAERRRRLESREGCWETGDIAPRSACGCRACYYAREKLLDPEIIALMDAAQKSQNIQSATPIVLYWANAYLSGRVTINNAHLGMIKSLVEQNEKLFANLMNFVVRSPPTVFIPVVDNTGESEK